MEMEKPVQSKIGGDVSPEGKKQTNRETSLRGDKISFKTPASQRQKIKTTKGRRVAKQEDFQKNILIQDRVLQARRRA
jgi:hypothetical protein